MPHTDRLAGLSIEIELDFNKNQIVFPGNKSDWYSCEITGLTEEGLWAAVMDCQGEGGEGGELGSWVVGPGTGGNTERKKEGATIFYTFFLVPHSSTLYPSI